MSTALKDRQIKRLSEVQNDTSAGVKLNPATEQSLRPVPEKYRELLFSFQILMAFKTPSGSWTFSHIDFNDFCRW